MVLKREVIPVGSKHGSCGGEAVKAEAGSRSRSGAEWKLQPDIVLMIPVCASHPCLNINIKAAQLGHTFIPRGHKHTNSSPTRVRRKPGVPTCVPQGFYSSPMLRLGLVFQRRGERRNSSPDRFRHTGFLL